MLPQLIAVGKFREDLYFRLNVVSIHIPPLRERRADIVPLAEHIAGESSPAVHARTGVRFSDDAKQALLAYQWPGNIRELKNVIERALVFGKSKGEDAERRGFAG